MIYSDYILKAKELTITYDEDSKFYYLEPDWQTILHENGLGDLEDVKDMYIEGWYDLEDVLKLEVERRNLIHSKLNIVLDWVHEVISSTIDPAALEDENNLIQSMIELSRLKNAESQ